MTLRYKRKMKRNKVKGIPGLMPMTSTANESNRLLHFSPNNSLISPNIFSAVQGTSNNPMLPTATRNPSTVAAASRKKPTPSLESLLTSSATTTPNGINQPHSTLMNAYHFGDISPTKQTKAARTPAAKSNANKGSEPAKRGPAAGTGVKRLV
jgi:hypothetical protein